MIKQSHTSFRSWVVCMSAALFFFYGFVQLNVFNALNQELYRAFHLTDETQLGRLSAMYFYANVIFLFPAGIILDRVSTRLLILVMMALCVISTFLFAMSDHFWQAELIRFLMGIWGSFFLLSNVRLASRWFPADKLALVIGVIVTLAMLGGMVAQAPLTMLTDEYGWRHTMIWDGFLGIFIWIIMLFLLRDHPPGQTEESIAATSHTSDLSFWKTLSLALGNIQNWLAGIYASMINLPIFLLGATFGSMYLVQAYHFDRKHASLIVSMIFIGMIVGSPIVGWISDRIKRRKLPMVIGAILAMIIVIAIMYRSQQSFLELNILFFLFGFVMAFQVIAYPVVAESNPESLTGTSEGIASVLIMGAGLLIPVFPWLLDKHWDHKMVNGFPVYSTSDYHLAFLMMPVAFAIALVAAFLLRETNCQSFSEREYKHNILEDVTEE